MWEVWWCQLPCWMKVFKVVTFVQLPKMKRDAWVKSSLFKGKRLLFTQASLFIFGHCTNVTVLELGIYKLTWKEEKTKLVLFEEAGWRLSKMTPLITDGHFLQFLSQGVWSQESNKEILKSTLFTYIQYLIKSSSLALVESNP